MKDALLFRAKASLFQIRRGFNNQLIHKTFRHPFQSRLKDYPLLAESRTQLWSGPLNDPVEKEWTLGKIHNLRLAASKLNGIEVPAGKNFSFWTQLGKLSRARGYVVGREVRQGCIIPTIGGGICQLSNALYDAALKANFTIVERHGHTVVIPGSLAEVQRDATVFWNYVDLRFQAPYDFRLEAELTAQELILRFRGNPESSQPAAQNEKFEAQAQPLKKSITTQVINSAKDCFSCGENSCSRSVKKTAQRFGSTAFLVDEFWPEYDTWIQKEKKSGDLLLAPLDGKFWKKSNYDWSLDGFKKVEFATFSTLKRAYAFRKLPAQGATLQETVLVWDEKLAQAYAKKIPFHAEHLVISQNLLPFLWKSGTLGGRTFDVLMTRLPMRHIQEILDQAQKEHPESPTLGDFRSSPETAELEDRALADAQRWITPHSKIAELAPQKTVKLEWKIPQNDSQARNSDSEFSKTASAILFPYPTLGRKGAYEMRDIVRASNAKLWIHPKNFEGADFWQGLNVELWKGPTIPNDVGLIIAPALVEHKARQLLQMTTSKIPIYASEACGLKGVTGIQTGIDDAVKNLKTAS